MSRREFFGLPANPILPEFPKFVNPQLYLQDRVANLKSIIRSKIPTLQKNKDTLQNIHITLKEVSKRNLGLFINEISIRLKLIVKIQIFDKSKNTKDNPKQTPDMVGKNRRKFLKIAGGIFVTSFSSIYFINNDPKLKKSVQIESSEFIKNIIVDQNLIPFCKDLFKIFQNRYEVKKLISINTDFFKLNENQSPFFRKNLSENLQDYSDENSKEIVKILERGIINLYEQGLIIFENVNTIAYNKIYLVDKIQFIQINLSIDGKVGDMLGKNYSGTLNAYEDVVKAAILSMPDGKRNSLGFKFAQTKLTKDEAGNESYEFVENLKLLYLQTHFEKLYWGSDQKEKNNIEQSLKDYAKKLYYSGEIPDFKNIYSKNNFLQTKFSLNDEVVNPSSNHSTRIANLNDCVTNKESRALSSSLVEMSTSNSALSWIIERLNTKYPTIVEFLGQITVLGDALKKVVPVSSTILDKHGKLMYKSQAISGIARDEADKEYLTLNREVFDIKDLNPDVLEFIKTAVTIEDGEFFSHKGIPGNGIINAVKNQMPRNIPGFGGDGRGGSGLTQQTIKNYLRYLSKDWKIDSYERKLVEYFGSVLLELSYEKLPQKEKKEKILDHYLNIISFGPNCMGLATAANDYFSKKVNDLTENEVYFLMSIIQDPIRKNPNIETGLENLRMSHKDTLNLLKSKGKISEVRYTELMNEDIILKPFKNVVDNIVVSSLLDEIYVDDRQKSVFQNGGIEIRTTYDIALTESLKAFVEEYETILGNANGGYDLSLLVRDSSGGVVCDLGGNDKAHLIGSTQKPLIVAANSSWQSTLTADSIIDDSELNIKTLTSNVELNVSARQLVGSMNPENRLLNRALSASTNPWAVRMLEQSYYEYYRLMKFLGIANNHLLVPRYSAFGIHAANPLNLSHIMHAVGNGGNYIGVNNVISINGQKVGDSKPVKIITDTAVKILKQSLVLQTGEDTWTYKTGTATSPIDPSKADASNTILTRQERGNGEGNLAVAFWNGNHPKNDKTIFGTPINSDTNHMFRHKFFPRFNDILLEHSY